MTRWKKSLEAQQKQRRKNSGEPAAVCAACRDSELALSYMFGNCYVKRLPKENIITVLRRKKGYLQTAGLISVLTKSARILPSMARSGVVRITRAGTMSEEFCGEAHDGQFPSQKIHTGW